MTKRRTTLAVGTAVALVATAAAVAAIAPIKPYAVGIAPGYDAKRLISVGDRVPETSSRSREYQMIGIPDGLGAHEGRHGTKVVYLNHELPSSVQSEPNVGGPLNRGAFVSRYILDRKGKPVSGERAYDWIYNENVFAGPAPEVGNATRAFSRFCSGSLAGPQHGFDRWIYLTNEEDGAPATTFDGRGGLAVAIVDNNLYTLPKLGRFAWENTLVQPTRGNRTVIMGMEDGPATQAIGSENSQLYMYVGKKVRHHGASVLRRNGLDNGTLYVLAPADGVTSEETVFRTGAIAVKWFPIPNAENMDEAQLEAASDAVNAFRFARTEDGAFNLRNRNEYVFVTTGGAPGADNLGRLWSLNLHPGNPLRPGTLEVVYNADDVIAGGGDIAISPDNIDVNRRHLMIQEDGTAESRLVMSSRSRDGSIWRFDIDRGGVDVSSRVRVVELDPPGRDGVPVGAGVWETSGIIETSALFGDGTWLFDVQAHSPTTPPGGPNTVEDGQLLLLDGPGGQNHDDHDDDDD